MMMRLAPLTWMALLFTFPRKGTETGNTILGRVLCETIIIYISP